MFTRWLAFIALLAGSISPGSQASGRRSVTFQSTCRVKGHPEEELMLRCGDGKHEGAVQFWHTPFGDLQSSGPRSNLDPVLMHRDGSLVIPNSSIHHGGLYYCVLRHAEGSTLWPYELRVGRGGRSAEAEEERGDGCAARRFRRNGGSPVEDDLVSHGIFAGAVAASVLLTFVVGFSAGALSRTHVLRCLQAVGVRQRRRQPDVPDGSWVTVTTLPPMYDDQAFRTGARRHDSPACATTETPAALTTPSPPAKPKRSFRDKEKAEPEGTAYLEGCDYSQAEEEKTGRRVDGEAEEEGEATELSFCLQEDEGSQNETEEDKSSEDREEEDGEASRERVEWREEVRDVEQEPTGTDDERSIKNEGETKGGEAAGEEPAPRSSRRRSRVIRLYQYDEDGQRYGHLADPAPEAPEPAPRLKQRSRSLTRLNAIMAAASAGPMERAEPAKQQGEEEERRFHMEI